jgi:hypothetical protein
MKFGAAFLKTRCAGNRCERPDCTAAAKALSVGAKTLCGAAPRPKDCFAERAALTQLRLLLIAFLLWPPVAAKAAAPECLSGIDSMIVEYDIPVGRQIWGLPPEKPSPATKPTSPPRKKTAKAAPNEGSGTAAANDKPAVTGRPAVPHHPLTEAQRKRLEETLQSARVAEARGEEAQCMELLGRAREIVKR